MQKPSEFVITCEKREVGQKAAAKLRDQKMIPVVIYGPKIKDNLHVAVPELEVEKILAKQTTQIVKFTIDGTTYDTLLKRIEYHPVTDNPLNIDFYALSEDHEVTITVPIRLTGTAPGITEGGRLFQPLRKIRVRCQIDKIPAELTLDISKLTIGDSLKVEKLDVEGFTPLMENHRTIVVIRPPKGGLKSLLGLEEDEEEGEDGAEGEEGAEEGAETAEDSKE